MEEKNHHFDQWHFSLGVMAQILDTPPTEKFIFPLLECGLVCDKQDYHAKKIILVIWRDHVERERSPNAPAIYQICE